MAKISPTQQAILESLGLHFLLITALFLSGLHEAPVSGAGDRSTVMEVQFVDSKELVSVLRQPEDLDDSDPVTAPSQVAASSPGTSQLIGAPSGESGESANGPTNGSEQASINTEERPKEDPRSAKAASAPDAMLEAVYLAAVRATIEGRWRAPASAGPPKCTVEVDRSAGPNATGVRFLSCPWGAIERDSILEAITSGPLPFAGFESVIQVRRPQVMEFCRPGSSC